MIVGGLQGECWWLEGRKFRGHLLGTRYRGWVHGPAPPGPFGNRAITYVRQCSDHSSRTCNRTLMSDTLHYVTYIVAIAYLSYGGLSRLQHRPMVWYSHAVYMLAGVSCDAVMVGRMRWQRCPLCRKPVVAVAVVAAAAVVAVVAVVVAAAIHTQRPTPPPPTDRRSIAPNGVTHCAQIEQACHNGSPPRLRCELVT